MSITDELRKWFKDRMFMGNGYAELTAIADRIDAEHERLMQEQPFTIDMVPMTDENMAEHGWVRLPVDADSEYINIHDWIEVDDGKRVRVDAITPNAVYWWDGDGCHWCQSFTVSHYHAPTVEDVLREFGDWYAHTKGGCDEDGIIAEYAAKLQLKEDA